MFGAFKKPGPNQPLQLTQLYGWTDPDSLVTTQILRLIDEWHAQHGVRPRPFNKLNRELFGLTPAERTALHQYVTERLHWIMLHDPALSGAAARLTKVLGSIDRAHHTGYKGWRVDDTAVVGRGLMLSCNRCALPMTFDHCNHCHLIDLDLMQFSHERDA